MNGGSVEPSVAISSRITIAPWCLGIFDRWDSFGRKHLNDLDLSGDRIDRVRKTARCVPYGDRRPLGRRAVVGIGY